MVIDNMTSLERLVTGLFSACRLVDLSAEVHPGVLKINGNYTWGTEQRRFELRQFVAPGPHFMHFVETESHVGTHVELPAHLVDGARSCIDMPLETFMGEAIVLKLDTQATGPQRLVMPQHLTRVRPRDIVLLWSPADEPEAVISLDAARLMADLPIRMLGVQNVAPPNDVHEALLLKDDAPIPIIEQLTHLEDLTRERVLFFGLPLRVAGLDASWIRAIAFEPLTP